MITYVELESTLKERCDEIERKYIEKQQTNNADREKEYMKNEELGMIF